MKNKYEVLEVVGRGTYGRVFKCRNRETGEFVAIKKFHESLHSELKPILIRELKLLRKIKHENIVEFKEAFRIKEKLHFVFEYVEKTLLQKLEEDKKGLSECIIQKIIFELCKSIGYLHSNNIIHRDIKPENVLLDTNNNVKLCDFGFAKILNKENHEKMTDYVSTRWYRAPEVIIGSGNYGPEVDFWAVGCLMAELINGAPLFPGENEIDQLNLINSLVGPLTPTQMKMITYKDKFKHITLNGKSNSLKNIFQRKLYSNGLNLMQSLLEIDPNKRIKYSDIINHPYFEKLNSKNFIKQSNSSPNLIYSDIIYKPVIKNTLNVKMEEKIPSLSRNSRNIYSVFNRNSASDKKNLHSTNNFLSSEVDNRESTKNICESRTNYNTLMKRMSESCVFMKKSCSKKTVINKNEAFLNYYKNGNEKIKKIIKFYGKEKNISAKLHNFKKSTYIINKLDKIIDENLNELNNFDNNSIEPRLNEIVNSPIIGITKEIVESKASKNSLLIPLINIKPTLIKNKSSLKRRDFTKIGK